MVYYTFARQDESIHMTHLAITALMSMPFVPSYGALVSESELSASIRCALALHCSEGSRSEALKIRDKE